MPKEQDINYLAFLYKLFSKIIFLGKYML